MLVIKITFLWISTQVKTSLSLFSLWKNSENQVYNAINQLKNKKSSDHSGLSNYLLKKFSFDRLPFLTKVFNDIFDEDYFPSKTRYTKIIPLHKSGSSGEPANFRPKVLINTISKVIKKIQHHKRYRFLKKIKLLDDRPFGFKLNTSRVDALSIVIEWALEKKNKKNWFWFLTFEKAFDTVNYSQLLEKLHKFGIRCNGLYFLENYLSNRYQYKKVNGIFWGTSIIDYGVPQWSAQERLFFLIFMNDISDLLLSKQTINSADTTAFICDPKQSATHRDIKTLEDWLKKKQIESGHRWDNQHRFRKRGFKLSTTEQQSINIKWSEVPGTYNL